MKSCEQIFFELPQCLSPWSQDAKMIKTWSSISQPRERETEIAVITQLAKAKTEIQGEQQEITKEASWAQGAGLRQSRQRATPALLRVFRSERDRSERQDSGGETRGTKGKQSR